VTGQPLRPGGRTCDTFARTRGHLRREGVESFERDLDRVIASGLCSMNTDHLRPTKLPEPLLRGATDHLMVPCRSSTRFRFAPHGEQCRFAHLAMTDGHRDRKVASCKASPRTTPAMLASVEEEPPWKHRASSAGEPGGLS